MQTPKPIPFHRHVEIGQQLHHTIEFLCQLRGELNEAKRHPNARQAANEITTIVHRFDILRNELENLLCSSVALNDDDLVTQDPCSVYYGPFAEVAK